jgi:hypothetical protein
LILTLELLAFLRLSETQLGTTSAATRPSLPESVI